MHTIREFGGNMVNREQYDYETSRRQRRLANSQPISRQTPYYRRLVILGSYLEDVNWPAVFSLGVVILGAWGTIELLRWIGK